MDEAAEEMFLKFPNFFLTVRGTAKFRQKLAL